MPRVLLDTNIAIFVIRQRPPQALTMFAQHAGRMAVSAITMRRLRDCARPAKYWLPRAR